MKVTTKKGDDGKTFFREKRIEKTRAEIRLLGKLDGAIAFLGLAFHITQNKELQKFQDYIYELMAYISTGEGSLAPIQENLDKMCEREVEIKGFLKPSGGAASIHIARTAIREAEIMSLEAFGAGEVSRLLNRMSDALFLVAYDEQRKEGSLKFFERNW